MNDKPLYDIAIIGAGPAGLTAAVYALRDCKKVILFEKNIEGGQVLNTSSIVNIPGFSEISGEEFISKMIDQINSFDNTKELLYTEYQEVLNIQKSSSHFEITTETNEVFYATSVVCATGSTYRTLKVPGEKELIGRGISFCSTCDAPFYKNKDVVVIGGGNSAMTEALELSNFAKSVHILQNLPSLTGSSDLIEKVQNNSKIIATFNVTVSGFAKDNGKINVLVHKSGVEDLLTVSVDGVFIAIGLEPNNHYMRNIGTVNEQGYIESLVDGAYAAGDCKKITANQVVVACGSGAKAAIKACRYLNSQK